MKTTIKFIIIIFILILLFGVANVKNGLNFTVDSIGKAEAAFEQSNIGKKVTDAKNNITSQIPFKK